MSIPMKVLFIFIIFAVNNTIAPPPLRTISRTNSAPELNVPRSRAFATRSNNRPTASTSSSKARNNVYIRSDVARRLSDDLNNALLSTNVEHLNPARDGYYASTNRVLARYGIATALGAAVGVGAVELYNRTHTIPELSTTSTTTEENIPLIE